MPIRWATTSGNWSNLAIWNDSASLGFPTASDDIWANGNNVNIDQSFSVVSLNSTARARDIATPAMTANNAPSPYVAAASTVNVVSTDAWKAFDRSLNQSTGYWQSANSVPSGSLSMDFGSGSSIIIDGYTIYGYSTQTFNPRYWTLESSNDNTTWTIRHTVSGAAAIAANGSYSVASIGNTTGSRYYRLNISLNGGATTVIVTELELYQPGTAALAAGGSFIFNSGSISGSATSTTAALSAGATNLIQVTATTGTVTLNLSSSVTGISAGPIMLHSGNCNFNLNGQNFTGGPATNIVCISKSSAGTINIIGNLIGNTGVNGAHALSSTNGNTTVIGNIAGATSTSSTGITQTAGNITVTGNVIGGAGIGISLTGAASQFTVIGNVTGGTATNAHGINFTGISGSVTGTVTSGNGSGARGINSTGNVILTGNAIGATSIGVASSGNITIIGNVTGGSIGPGAASLATIAINVTGTVTAGAGSAGIDTSNGTAATVNLTGNMINVSGRQAIFAQNLFISNTATSQWRLFTQGGQDKTLYSADTFPNQPSPANVRSGSLYGPSNTLSGSMVVPAPSDVRVNVLTDNTVGTGQSLTAADFLAAISASADPFAQRLRNVATVDTVGSLVTGLNGGF